MFRNRRIEIERKYSEGVDYKWDENVQEGKNRNRAKMFKN